MDKSYDLQNYVESINVRNVCWYLKTVAETQSNEVQLNSSIHFNPNLYESRNIYINKAHCSNNLSFQKDRIYYNPKFLQAGKEIENVVTESLQNKENRVLLNPLFMKNKSEKYLNTLSDVHKDNNISCSAKKEKFPVSKGIHLNPKFIQSSVPSRNLSEESVQNSCSASYLNNANFLRVKPQKVKHISKYKLIRSQNNFSTSLATKEFPYRTKYLHDREKCAISKEPFNYLTEKRNCSNSYTYVNPVSRKSILRAQIEARRKVRKLSSSFKISRFKYVRNKKEVQPSSYRKHHYYRTNSERTSKPEYKYLNRTKLIRKSVVQKQIESRRQIKRNFKKINTNSRISKYKIIHNKAVLPQKDCLSDKTVFKNNFIKKKLQPFTNKYRVMKKRKVAMMKKLKKNNQPCPFYGRFGRCKGRDKGTCPKLHDPKYITICKKFLKGECTEKNCLLSHDIRPEKMPTCHHYLSGICTRSDCPYLHIKVNDRAAICKSFLQGFCADVFNCRKRHEYVCPIYTEKGSCPKGKCCRYPHRNTISHSKLLEPDQIPILESTKMRKIIKKTGRSPAKVSTKESEESSQADISVDSAPRLFSRYFSQPLISENLQKNNED